MQRKPGDELGPTADSSSDTLRWAAGRGGAPGAAGTGSAWEVAGGSLTAAVLEHVPDAVVVIDAAGRVTFANRPAREWGLAGIAGVEAAALRDLFGEPLAGDLLPAARAMRGEPVVGQELLLRRADGVELILRADATPWGPPGARRGGAITVYRNVTEAKSAEAASFARNQSARESARRQARLTHRLGMQIRGPLNQVVMLGHLLRRLMRMQLTTDAAQCLDGIETGIRAALGLASDVAELAVLEAGGAEIELAEFDPGEALADAVRVLRPSAEQKGLFILTELTTLYGRRFTCDRGLYRRVIDLVLAAAVARTVEGGLVVRGRAVGDDVEIDVQDTGPAVADGAALLDPAAQAAVSSTSQDGPAGGLGPAVAAKLAAALGGGVIFVAPERSDPDGGPTGKPQPQHPRGPSTAAPAHAGRHVVDVHEDRPDPVPGDSLTDSGSRNRLVAPGTVPASARPARPRTGNTFRIRLPDGAVSRTDALLSESALPPAALADWLAETGDAGTGAVLLPDPGDTAEY